MTVFSSPLVVILPLLLVVVVLLVDGLLKKIKELRSPPIDPEDLEAIERARTGGSWRAKRRDSTLRDRFMTPIRLYRLTVYGGQGQSTAAHPDAGTREIRDEVRET